MRLEEYLFLSCSSQVYHKSSPTIRHAPGSIPFPKKRLDGEQHVFVHIGVARIEVDAV